MRVPTNKTGTRKLHAVLLTGALALAMGTMLPPTMGFAQHLKGSSAWKVTHTQDGALEDNYSESDFEADIQSMQPGDDLTVSVKLQQAADGDSDWYVSNEVLKSLEAGDAEGSGYGYALSYEKPDGTIQELYRSESVGGTGSVGLIEATKSLDNYIYLDTLSKGQEGRVILSVTLDGETEQNAYADKFARIRLMFAVENQGEHGSKESSGQKEKDRDIVKTGEETNLLPLHIAMTVSGLGIVGFVTYDMAKKKGGASR